MIYKQPQFAGVNRLPDTDPKTVFVGAAFISSGRQDYCVAHQDRLYFHTCLADFRRERMVFRNQQEVEKKRVERNPNVFTQWASDTERVVEKCCQKDFA